MIFKKQKVSMTKEQAVKSAIALKTVEAIDDYFTTKESLTETDYDALIDDAIKSITREQKK